MSNETIQTIQEIEQEAEQRLLHAGITPHDRACDNILHAEQFGLMQLSAIAMREALAASIQAEAVTEPALGAAALQDVNLVLAEAI